MPICPELSGWGSPWEPLGLGGLICKTAGNMERFKQGQLIKLKDKRVAMWSEQPACRSQAGTGQPTVGHEPPSCPGQRPQGYVCFRFPGMVGICAYQDPPSLASGVPLFPVAPPESWRGACQAGLRAEMRDLSRRGLRGTVSYEQGLAVRMPCSPQGPPRASLSFLTSPCPQAPHRGLGARAPPPSASQACP